MKLISENRQEDRIINGLSRLLLDLGIEAEPYRREEAVSLIFWSAEDLNAFSDIPICADKSRRARFLLQIEDELSTAMISAGYKKLCEELVRRENT